MAGMNTRGIVNSRLGAVVAKRAADWRTTQPGDVPMNPDTLAAGGGASSMWSSILGDYDREYAMFGRNYERVMNSPTTPVEDKAKWEWWKRFYDDERASMLALTGWDKLGGARTARTRMAWTADGATEKAMHDEFIFPYLEKRRQLQKQMNRTSDPAQRQALTTQLAALRRSLPATEKEALQMRQKLVEGAVTHPDTLVLPGTAKTSGDIRDKLESLEKGSAAAMGGMSQWFDTNPLDMPYGQAMVQQLPPGTRLSGNPYFNQKLAGGHEPVSNWAISLGSKGSMLMALRRPVAVDEKTGAVTYEQRPTLMVFTPSDDPAKSLAPISIGELSMGVLAGNMPKHNELAPFLPGLARIEALDEMGYVRDTAREAEKQSLVAATLSQVAEATKDPNAAQAAQAAAADEKSLLAEIDKAREKVQARLSLPPTNDVDRASRDIWTNAPKALGGSNAASSVLDYVSNPSSKGYDRTAMNRDVATLISSDPATQLKEYPQETQQIVQEHAQSVATTPVAPPVPGEPVVPAVVDQASATVVGDNSTQPPTQPAPAAPLDAAALSRLYQGSSDAVAADARLTSAAQFFREMGAEPQAAQIEAQLLDLRSTAGKGPQIAKSIFPIKIDAANKLVNSLMDADDFTPTMTAQKGAVPEATTAYAQQLYEAVKQAKGVGPDGQINAGDLAALAVGMRALVDEQQGIIRGATARHSSFARNVLDQMGAPAGVADSTDNIAMLHGHARAMQPILAPAIAEESRRVREHNAQMKDYATKFDAFKDTPAYKRAIGDRSSRLQSAEAFMNTASNAMPGLGQVAAQPAVPSPSPATEGDLPSQMPFAKPGRPAPSVGGPPNMLQRMVDDRARGRRLTATADANYGKGLPTMPGTFQAEAKVSAPTDLPPPPALKKGAKESHGSMEVQVSDRLMGMVAKRAATDTGTPLSPEQLKWAEDHGITYSNPAQFQRATAMLPAKVQATFPRRDGTPRPVDTGDLARAEANRRRGGQWYTDVDVQTLARDQAQRRVDAGTATDTDYAIQDGRAPTAYDVELQRGSRGGQVVDEMRRRDTEADRARFGEQERAREAQYREEGPDGPLGPAGQATQDRMRNAPTRNEIHQMKLATLANWRAQLAKNDPAKAALLSKAWADKRTAAKAADPTWDADTRALWEARWAANRELDAEFSDSMGKLGYVGYARPNVGKSQAEDKALRTVVDPARSPVTPPTPPSASSPQPQPPASGMTYRMPYDGVQPETPKLPPSSKPGTSAPKPPTPPRRDAPVTNQPVAQAKPAGDQRRNPAGATLSMYASESPAPSMLDRLAHDMRRASVVLERMFR